MEKLNLFVKDEYYYIQSDRTNFVNLCIHNGKAICLFEEVEERTWRVQTKKLISMLGVKKGDKGFIYHGDGEEITASEYDINILSDLNCDGTITICLYISLDEKVRFLFGGPPSARSYYQSSQPVAISTTKNDDLKIDMIIKTNYLPLSSSDLIISNRQTKQFIQIESSHSSSVNSGNNQYDNHVTCTVKPKEIMDSVDEDWHYLRPNLAILDLFIIIHVKESELSSYKFRLPYEESLPSLVWCHFDNDQSISFKWYPTDYGNLSARVSFLQENTIHSYEDEVSKWQKEKETKPIILVSEYVHKAQDNGLSFFSYLMENQTELIPYYIVSKDSKDLPNLKKYEDNIVFYKSPEHVRLFFEATYLAHTHASSYVMPIISEEAEEKRQELKKVFLQHGMLLMKNVEYLYGKKSNPSFTNAFIVSSEREKKIVEEEYFYPIHEIKITGLSRFDQLLKGNNRLKTFLLRKNILIIPTWRRELSLLNDESFMKSDFYKEYMALINHSELRKMALKRKLKITFYLHANFQKFTHLFSSDFINIMTEGDKSVQSLLKDNGILITDYSSVSLDFSLLRRTVLYYQIEENLYEQQDISKEEMERQLPGPIFKDSDEMIKELAIKTKKNRLNKNYEDNLKTRFYAYEDLNASQRILDVIKTL